MPIMVDEVKVCSTSLLQRERPEFIFNLGACRARGRRRRDATTCQHLYVMLPMIGNGPEIQRKKMVVLDFQRAIASSSSCQ